MFRHYWVKTPPVPAGRQRRTGVSSRIGDESRPLHEQKSPAVEFPTPVRVEPLECKTAMASGMKIAKLWNVTTFVVLLSGCSTTSGLLVADVFRAEGAWVVAIQGFGTTLRTLADDAGMTFGYERRVYVYPETTDDFPTEGRHYWLVRLPKRPALAVNTRIIGLDMRASGVDLGFTLGYRDATVLAQVPVGASRYMRLTLSPDDAAATHLTYCTEEHPCWPIDISYTNSVLR